MHRNHPYQGRTPISQETCTTAHSSASHFKIAYERFRQNPLTQTDRSAHGSDQPRIPARPHTHQPIHTDKEHITRHFLKPAAPQSDKRRSDLSKPLSMRSIKQSNFGRRRSTTILNYSFHQTWWRQTGSNRRPPACKAGALPAELCPQTWWAREDLNLRPHAYQACALTN